MKLLLFIVNIQIVYSAFSLSKIVDHASRTVLLPLKIVQHLQKARPTLPPGDDPRKTTTVAPDVSCVDYKDDVDLFERMLYSTTFNSLTKSNSPERSENGISFVQSGLFVYLLLMAFSTSTKSQEDYGIFSQFNCDVKSKIDLIDKIVSDLPVPNDCLKFRWTSHLVLPPHLLTQSDNFQNALYLTHVLLNSTNDLSDVLNNMLEKETRGTFKDIFEEIDFEEPLQILLASTLYFRNHWRVSPTLLNNSIPFEDEMTQPGMPPQTIQAMRINDIVGYADVREWDAEAVEIQYATKGMSLLIIVPRGKSLKNVVRKVHAYGTSYVLDRLLQRRIEITIPIFSLRMTLLLPEKLKTMNLHNFLMEANNDPNNIKLSHAVQGVMFWLEAGKNAFKDDGLQWDKRPEYKMTLDRPFAFFVRWNERTLLSGNFVL